MQRNNTPVLLITIVLGVLALGATAFFLLRPSAQPPAPVAAVVPTPTPAALWVAARDIPPRTVINSTMLRQDYQSGAAPSGAITSLDQVRGMITKEPINVGEPVLVASFTPRIHRQIDANIPIPPNMRGVAIYVDPDQTAAGLVDVGDHVDVVVTNRLTYDKAPRQYVVGALNFTTGRTIAQNLQVLGVDRSIKAPAPTPTPVPGAPVAAAGPPPPPTPVPPPATPGTRTRVLLAAPADIAERLIAANDQGTLHITIRNPMDGDAGAVPEAREYPSRVYTAPAPPSASSGGGGRRTREPEMGPPPTFTGPGPATIPTLPPPATGTGTGGTGMGEEAASKEITVIRGTEKTRVIVPQR